MSGFINFINVSMGNTLNFYQYLNRKLGVNLSHWTITTSRFMFAPHCLRAKKELLSSTRCKTSRLSPKRGSISLLQMIRNWRSSGVIQRASLMYPPIFSPHFEGKKKALKCVQLISSAYSWPLLNKAGTVAIGWLTFDMFTACSGKSKRVRRRLSPSTKSLCVQPPAEWRRKQAICFNKGVTKEKSGVFKRLGKWQWIFNGFGSLYGNFITVMYTVFWWCHCFYVCSADFFFLTRFHTCARQLWFVNSERGGLLAPTFYISIYLLWFRFPTRSSVTGTFDGWALHWRRRTRYLPEWQFFCNLLSNSSSNHLINTKGVTVAHAMVHVDKQFLLVLETNMFWQVRWF